MLNTFYVSINGSHTSVLLSRTNKLGLAAVQALAMLEYEKASDYDVVKIWSPSSKPFFYAVKEIDSGLEYSVLLETNESRMF